MRLRSFLGGDQRVFNCPAQDERFEWQKGRAPAGLKLVPATPAHAQLGYQVGEPLLDGFRTPFSYSYNVEGAPFQPEGDPFIGRGLGFFVRLSQGRVWGHQLRVGRVRSTSQLIAITDASADGWYDLIALPHSPEATVWPGTVHNGGANVLFCEGHVQWYPQKALLVSPDGPTPQDAAIRCMWNNDNRP